MLPPETLAQAQALLTKLQRLELTLATAESCTGGLIAGALTAIPGSSATLLGGFVTYSNAMKTKLLGVSEDILEGVGAVSEACARDMAAGALQVASADIAVSCTGIAGPDGGSAEKPVGLVFIGVARRGMGTEVKRFVFPGDRAAIRAATVVQALKLVERVADA
ncbi:nicotinamide-nucleotide amidase [Humitalea rosea]|uniref:Nicotinamide-nucleotide amidase n=1 Tax=Humitalea rosea TaxID=990373 RepID=A0A2W7IG92_9PROT|nr:CinA family protein [Humitalea rosea]PZW45596.1 nicotinamide-nucleotide amidase [Humitalea rosea]